ncbi:hypothetical protein LAN16_24240, partial [Mycobacterium tuberculosis]|nr:hypothetical protein [Mycobacterium tuberculosis]
VIAIASLPALERKELTASSSTTTLSPVFSIQPYKLNGISIPALAPTSSLSLLLALVYHKEVFSRTD